MNIIFDCDSARKIRVNYKLVKTTVSKNNFSIGLFITLYIIRMYI